MDIRQEFEQKYIFHPYAKSIIGQWRRLHNLGRGKNRGVILSGVPGTGKTELAKSFLNSLPYPSIEGTESIPYLYYQLSNNVAPSQILDSLLHMMECPFEQSKYKSRLTAVKAMIEARGVQWIVFDEFQRLRNQTSKKFHAPAINFICSFLDDIQRPVLLITNPEGLSIREDNKQVLGRFTRLKTLDPMSISTLNQMAYYLFFLEEFERQIPWQTTPLGTINMAYRIYAATEGNNRDLKSLLLAATEFSNSMQETITLDHYAMAFEDLGNPTNIDWNPFSTDIKKIKKYLGVEHDNAALQQLLNQRVVQ